VESLIKAESPRFALCGNVFRVETAEDARALMEQGQLPQLRGMLTESAIDPTEVGFGLYLPARATEEMFADVMQQRRWLHACKRSGWPIWTANAFPFGGFHSEKVKELAFQPDWTTSERLQFTCQVADLLAMLMRSGSKGSISTCPLGYGPELAENTQARDHLQAAEQHLAEIHRQKGVHLVLSLEPEPDGGFERVADLAAWLHQHFPGSEYLGVCWDLCHGEVVGETAEQVLAALEQYQVPCGKVQISAALLLQSIQPPVDALLNQLADDPWFHQVRSKKAASAAGQSALDPATLRWRDLPDFLASEAYQHLKQVGEGEYGIHCHVPVHRADYLPGLAGTEWRGAVKAALGAGIRDFELETYTLPVLPAELLEEQGLLGTFFAEISACFHELGLDTTRTNP
jgi:hypothetical protein